MSKFYAVVAQGAHSGANLYGTIEAASKREAGEQFCKQYSPPAVLVSVRVLDPRKPLRIERSLGWDIGWQLCDDDGKAISRIYHRRYTVENVIERWEGRGYKVVEGE